MEQYLKKLICSNTLINKIPDSLINVMLQDKQWLDNNYGADIATDLLQTSINWKAYAQIQDTNWTKAWSYMNLYEKNFPIWCSIESF